MKAKKTVSALLACGLIMNFAAAFASGGDIPVSGYIGLGLIIILFVGIVVGCTSLYFKVNKTRLAAAKSFRCPQCGWAPAEGNMLPGKCPECGLDFMQDFINSK